MSPSGRERHPHRPEAELLILAALVALAAIVIREVRPLARSPRAIGAMAAPMSTATPSPLPSEVDPTPFGRPIELGAPVPTPPLSADAIRPENVDRLVVIARLAAPPGGESAQEHVLGFSRDGQRLYSKHYADLLVRQSADGRQVDSLPALPMYDRGPQVFSLDDRYAIGPSPDANGYVDIWDLAGHERARQHRGGETVVAMALDRNGQLLAAGRYDGRISIWELGSGALLAHFMGAMKPSGQFAFHPIRDEIATADGPGPGVLVRRARTAAVLKVLEGPAGAGMYASQVAWRPDGQALAAVRITGLGAARNELGPADVVLWRDDAYAGRVSLPDTRFSPSIAWSPDGRWLAVLHRPSVGPGYLDYDPRLMVWDTQSEVIELWDPSLGDPQTVGWSPDSGLLAVGHGRFEPNVYGAVLWDSTSWSVVARLPGLTQPAFSPDQSRLVLHDYATGRASLVLTGIATATGPEQPPLVPTPRTHCVTPTPGPRPTSILLYPNLVVQGMAVDHVPCESCGPANAYWGVVVEVGNAGSGGSGPFQVEVDGSRRAVRGLNAGEFVNVFFPGLPGGDTTAIVDPDDEVEEYPPQSEADNLLRGALPTRDAMPEPGRCTPEPTDVALPDLSVMHVGISLHPAWSCRNPDEHLVLYAKVENRGSVGADAFLVSLNGTPRACDVLDAGSRCEVNSDEVRLESQQVVVADSSDQVTESDETNNTRRETVPVPTMPLCPSATWAPRNSCFLPALETR